MKANAPPLSQGHPPNTIQYLKTPRGEAFQNSDFTVSGSVHTSQHAAKTARMGKVNVADKDTKKTKTEFCLVRVKGTWKRKLAKEVKKDTGECVSAAKM